MRQFFSHTRILLFSFLFGVPFIGCDTWFVIRGQVVEDSSAQSIVIAQNPGSDTSRALAQVLLSLYYLRKDSVWDDTRRWMTLCSDLRGQFEIKEIIGPGQYNFGLLAAKEGYVTDTLFFRCSGGDTINVVICLRKQ